jgi:hypothetical protein
MACVAVGGLSVALADPPAPAASTPAAATQAAPAASSNAPAATPAAAPAAASPTAAVTVTAQDDMMEKHFLSEGYKIEMHHGEKYFCRREEELGSRLGGQKYCSSVQQLAATEKEAQHSVDKSMMQQNNPSGR